MTLPHVPKSTLARRANLPLAVAAFLMFTLPLAALGADSPKDFSPAEKALFMTDQFAGIKPPLTLRYTFRKSGSLEPGFADQATLQLKSQADGSCCAASGEFLGGERRVELPPVDSAQGNPVTLYFLERDIREMERLTKGKANYFRKRIRMAVYQGAQVRDVSVTYKGKPVAAREFTIAPYLDDPNKQRFERFTNKRYVFTLSSAVPGGVYGIRSSVGGDAADAPLLADELLIDGAGNDAPTGAATPAKP